jgi:hypothetical protein
MDVDATVVGAGEEDSDGLEVGDSGTKIITGTSLASTPTKPSFTSISVISPDVTESSKLDSIVEPSTPSEDVTVYFTVIVTASVTEVEVLSTDVTTTSDGSAPVISATASRRELSNSALEASSWESPAIT